MLMSGDTAKRSTRGFSAGIRSGEWTSMCSVIIVMGGGMWDSVSRGGISCLYAMYVLLCVVRPGCISLCDPDGSREGGRERVREGKRAVEHVVRILSLLLVRRRMVRVVVDSGVITKQQQQHSKQQQHNRYAGEQLRFADLDASECASAGISLAIRQGGHAHRNTNTN